MISFFVPEIFTFSYYANLVTDDVSGYASTVVRHKIENISANNEANAVETWQGCCILRNIQDGIHFDVTMATCSVPVSCPFKINFTICQSTRQNTWSYLRYMPVPPSLSLLFNIFNCIFCPMQLQMVKFDFKEEGTGTEHQIVHHLVYFLGCNIPAKFQ